VGFFIFCLGLGQVVGCMTQFFFKTKIQLGFDQLVYNPEKKMLGLLIKLPAWDEKPSQCWVAVARILWKRGL